MSLGDGRRAPKILTVYGLTKRDAVFIWRLVAEHQEMLLAEWEKIHG